MNLPLLQTGAFSVGRVFDMVVGKGERSGHVKMVFNRHGDYPFSNEIRRRHPDRGIYSDGAFTVITTRRQLILRTITLGDPSRQVHWVILPAKTFHSFEHVRDSLCARV